MRSRHVEPPRASTSTQAGPGATEQARPHPGGPRQDRGNAARAEELGMGRLPFLAELEAAFGEDLGGVKVRVDAGGLHALRAEAANEGDTVVLPGPGADLETVAHEVAHVLQRRRGVEATAHQRPGGVSSVEDPAEREAEQVGRRVSRGERVRVQQRASAPTMRKAVAGGESYNVDPKTKNEHPGKLSDGSKDYTRIEETSHGNAIKTQYSTHIYDNLGTERGRLDRGQAVRLNAGQRREIEIGGKKVECLLVFAAPDADTGKHTTGWVKAAALPDSVNSESWNPTIAGKHCKVTDDTYEVTDTACPADIEDLYVYPSQDGHENKAKYYFSRNGVVNFLLNLPYSGGGRYGSARDILAPGTGLRRADKPSEKVALYARNSREVVGHLTFVYARVAGRFGWINHACLDKR